MNKSDCITETEASVLQKIRHISYESSEYPDIFRHLPRMPREFYVLGSLPDPGKKTVAIVGARGCTPYGKSEAVRFGKALAMHGVQTVSGMAYGIDAWSQQGTLEGGGQTFAVLGSGVDVCYPSRNYSLYRKIIQSGGGIISEFPPGTPPVAWHFPIRNRIISAFADVVLVVEARLRSGSLITADYALEQGKTIFAVPGRNKDALSEGCNRLIYEGAGIAWSPDSVLAELGLDAGKEYFAAGSAGISDGRARIPRSPMDRINRLNPHDGTPGTRRMAYTRTDERSGNSQPDNPTDRSSRTFSGSDAAEITLPENRFPEKSTHQYEDSVPAGMPAANSEHAEDFQKVFRILGCDPVSTDVIQKRSRLDIRTVSSVLMQLVISGFAEEYSPGFYIRKL